MESKLIRILISQQVKNIIDDRKLTSYKLMKMGVSQSVQNALLQKNEKKNKTYTIDTLNVFCNALKVKEVTITENSVLIVC